MSVAIANFEFKSGESVSGVVWGFASNTTGQRARVEIRLAPGGPLIQAFDTADSTLTNTGTGYHPATGQVATTVAADTTFKYELWTVDTLSQPNAQAEGTWTVRATVMQGL